MSYIYLPALEEVLENLPFRKLLAYGAISPLTLRFIEIHIFGLTSITQYVIYILNSKLLCTYFKNLQFSS